MKLLPKNWRMVTLKEIAHRITDGTHQPPKFQADGVPFLVISNVVNGTIDWFGVSKWVSQQTFEKLTAHCRPERGDVLYTAVGSYGTAIPVETDKQFLFQRHIAHIKPNATLVETRFLAHLLNGPDVRAAADRVARGVAQKTVTLGDLKEFTIHLPPLDEQRRIADILDKADAVRRKRKEAIALTEELLRSAFLEMFGDPVTNPKAWPRKTLGELAQVQGGLQVTHARSIHPRRLPYLRVANVYRNRLDLAEIKEIGVSDSEYGRCRLERGDILVVEGHGNPEELGRAAIWDGSIQDMTHQNHLIRVRANGDAVRSTFLSAFLNSSEGRRQMLGSGKTTSGLNTISTNNVRSITVLLPPVRLQGHFESVVQSHERLMDRLSSSLAASDALFASLLHRAFRGELTAPASRSASPASKQLSLLE